jgi:hypothetical protein
MEIGQGLLAGPKNEGKAGSFGKGIASLGHSVRYVNSKWL